MSDYWLTHCDNCGKPEQDCRCNDEKRIAELTEQRDELLAALKELRKYFTSGNYVVVSRAVISAEAFNRITVEAIAKAEKK